MLMISFVSLLFIIFTRWLHQVVKYAYHQIINFCDRIIKVNTTHIPYFAFVLLHLFQGTNSNCEMIESL